MAGKIYVGIGGWTFEPWRGVFYPEGLTHKRELEYASRKLTSIEINGTYYSSFKPASWAKWRAETPDGFVFAMKASRFCTNRRQLAEAGESVKRFVDQGLVELGDRLGPINWQFMGTKKFDPEDIEAFLKLLPREAGKLPLRHALEVRHPSFKDPRFYDLARKYNAAIIYAHDEDFPEIDEPTADFTYARLMGAQEKVKTGYKPADIDKWAKTRQGMGQEGRCLRVFHLRRQGAQSSRRAGADRQGLESRGAGFMGPPFPPGMRVEEIETGGATIHTRVGGQGPAVVMLHGFGDTGDMWAPLAAALVASRTVVVPDLRGMGLSSHPERGYDKKTQGQDVARLLDRLGSTRRTSSPTTSATWWATPLPRSIRRGSRAGWSWTRRCPASARGTRS